NAYIAGHTTSPGFPVTPGALNTSANASNGIGFITKLAPDAKLIYSSFLGTISPPFLFTPVALLVGSGGVATIGGTDGSLLKLNAADWRPVFAARFGGPCGSRPGAVVVDSAGSTTISLISGAGFPLRNPFLAGPTCGATSSIVTNLSPDGSAVHFSTYLDACGA